MHFLDWLSLLVLVGIVAGFAFWTKRYNRSVADFMAANRSAGRYLLAVSEGVALMGAISFVADFQRYYVGGFSILFWPTVFGAPVMAVVALSGWVIYRFRQTRCLTLGQFLGVRYSKGFRIFAALLLFVAGIINFGIFPGIGARFFIYFCGFPETFTLLGFEIETYIIGMLVLLSLALLVTFLGGQIAVMVTDFLQGIMILAILLVIVTFFFSKFSWGTISEALLTAPAEGKSLVNPFHTGNASGLNGWWYLVVTLSAFYNCMNWQNTQGYNASAKSPHEARMGRIIGFFRANAYVVAVIFIGISAFTVLNHPSYASLGVEIREAVAKLGGDRAQSQMIAPLLLAKTLPVGLIGAFCAAVLYAFVSTHDTFLHSWGTIFIQDIVLPLRKTPLTTKQHMKWLKVSIFGVAVFAFLWSAFFRFDEYIQLYWMITSAIFLGGSGAVVIGGLYWKRGTTAAAYTALISGAVISGAGFVVRSIYPDFPLEAYWITLIAMGFSSVIYIVVSLLGGKTKFNMDRMLHRGEYAVEEDRKQSRSDNRKRWKKIFAITNEFTRFDIFIYFLSFGWVFGLSLACIVASICYFAAPKLGFTFGDQEWLMFWRGILYTFYISAFIFTAWITVGGIRDIRNLFNTLKTARRSDLDDGRVAGHHNLADDEPLSALTDEGKGHDDDSK